MSLIQEALKRKTEEKPRAPEKTSSFRPAQASPPRVPRPPQPRSPANNPSRTISVVFSILIVLILLAAGGAYFLLTQPKPAADQAAETQTATPVAAVPVPAPVPVPEPAPAPVPKPAVTWPDIVFAGTATSANESLAIIDGRMLPKGDTINGITVLQIGQNKVLLEYEGEKRLFRLN